MHHTWIFDVDLEKNFYKFKNKLYQKNKKKSLQVQLEHTPRVTPGNVMYSWNYMSGHYG